jgi:SAM-dependent methyltransferase
VNVDWNKIYSTRGLYSGHGSRGDCAALKVKAIIETLQQLRPKTLLDVGCGDLFVMRQVDLAGVEYTGLDRSTVLIDQISEQDLLGNLITGDFGSMHFDRTWDITLCLDLLIHFSDRGEYLDFARRLLSISRYGLLVSGFAEETRNTRQSSVIHYHESLYDTFAGCEIQMLGEYRDCVLALVLPPSPQSNTCSRIKQRSTPRRIWTYWETAPDANRPEYLDLCEATWQKHCGMDFEIVRVTPETARQFAPDLPECWERIPCLAHKADYLRAMLVHRHGGFWLDNDIIVLRNLSEMAEELEASGSDFIGCGRPGNRPSNGVFGGKPGCKLLGQYIEAMNEFLASKGDDLQFAWTDIGYKLLWPLTRDYEYYQYEFCRCIPVPPSKQKVFFEQRSLDALSPSECDLRENTLTVYLYNAMFPASFKAMTGEQVVAADTVIGQLFRRALGEDMTK